MARATATGYCWPQSVQVGDSVGLHVSSSDDRPVTIEVARIGRARTVVFHEDGVVVGDHPTPPEAATIGCDWPAARHLTVDASWRSMHPPDPQIAAHVGSPAEPPVGLGGLGRLARLGAPVRRVGSAP